MSTPPSLTVISDEVSQRLSELTAFQREFSLTGLELRSFNGRGFKDLMAADVDEIARASRAEGWKIMSCATPVFKCALDEASAVAEHREIFKRCLDVAVKLECDLLRVFSFLRQGSLASPGVAARVTAELQGLIDLARGSGVRIGVENEHTCLAGTAEETLGVVAPLPPTLAGIIWDPCNVLYIPDAAPPTTAHTRLVLPRTFHIHVKDAVRRSSEGGLAALAMPVGIGEVGWRGQFSVLREAGYAGWLSLETHWRVLALDESLLHLPAGFQFSEGGQVASRTCLHNINAIWETL